VFASVRKETKRGNSGLAQVADSGVLDVSRSHQIVADKPPLRFKDGPSALRRTERLIVVDSIVTRLLDTYISHVVVATGTIVVP
jgi:hypothetical protein